MKPHIDPKVDFAFKRLFGHEKNRAILMSLLNAVLESSGGRRIVDLQILNPFSLKEALDDKTSIVDISAVDQDGRKFFVEMQMAALWHFPKRVLYYWARRHQEQLLEGDEYQSLKPTIGICFLDGVLFTEAACHVRFRPLSDDGRLLFCGDMEIHLLQLPKLGKSLAELRTPLEKWLYFLCYEEELEMDPWPAQLDIPEIRQAHEELLSMAQNPQERALYESRLKRRRDDRMIMLEAERIRQEADKVRQEADKVRREAEQVRQEAEQVRQEAVVTRQQSREEGYLDGLRGKIRSYTRLLRLSSPTNEQLGTLNKPELEGLAAQLELQMAERLNRSNGQSTQTHNG